MAPRTALKALAVMTALLAAGGFGSWALQSTLARAAPLEAADFSNGAQRLQQLIDALPAVARTPDSVLVLGSSLTQHGFSPERYEQGLAAQGKHATAFNLGVPGADTDVQRALAERICAEYSRAGTQAKRVLLEVTPFQLTLAYSRDAKNRELDDLKLASLLSPAVFGRLAKTSPTEAAHVLAIDAQGQQSAFVSASVLSTMTIERTPRWWPLAEPSDPLAERKQLASAMRSATHQPEWDPATRGEPRYFTTATAETYARWRSLKVNDELLRSELQWRIETADILERRFDPARVEQLYATIAELQPCAQSVQLWVAPTNARYVVLTPDGQARQRALFDSLAANGHPVIDLNAQHAFVVEDFIDTTHLEEEWGRPRLSRRLADPDLSGF